MRAPCRRLSPYGIEQGRLSEERMAMMSSVYWGVMCAGRVVWAAISGVITSTWPMLFFDVIVGPPSARTQPEDHLYSLTGG